MEIVMKKGFILSFVILVVFGAAYAQEITTLSQSLSAIVGLFSMVTQIFTGMAYIIGLMLFVAAIMKFRQHRDNPQQVTIGQPLTLFGLSVLAIFLPGFLNIFGVFLGGQSVGAGATNTTVLPGASS